MIEQQPKSITLTDDNMLAWFIANYGPKEGPLVQADVHKFGAEKAIELVAGRVNAKGRK